MTKYKALAILSWDINILVRSMIGVQRDFFAHCVKNKKKKAKTNTQNKKKRKK